jgi:hypothetical protein
MYLRNKYYLIGSRDRVSLVLSIIYIFSLELLNFLFLRSYNQSNFCVLYHLVLKRTRGIMPNETAISNSSNCTAWQQSSSNNNTMDTPPDSAGLPV